MPRTFTTTRRVQWRDTDAAGIMHFSAFFTYMEEVEHELLRHAGLSVLATDEAGKISWPRVAAHCEYTSSVRFEDEIIVQANVRRLGEKSVTYAFRFEHNEKLLADGSLTAVCCRLDPGGELRSIPIPQGFRDKLGDYLVTAANTESN